MCGVLAELAHRLGLAARARERGLLDPLGVEHRDRDLAIAVLDVVSAVHALAPAAAEKALEPVATVDQLGHRERRRGLRARHARRLERDPQESQKLASDRLRLPHDGQRMPGSRICDPSG